MKNILLLLSILMLTFSSFAQKIKVKRGVIKVDREPFIKMEKISKFRYVIYNIQGEELMNLMPDTKVEGNYFVTFKNRKETGLIPIGIPIKKSIVRTILYYEIINDGQLNEEGLAKFVTMSDRREERFDKLRIVEKTDE